MGARCRERRSWSFRLTECCWKQIPIGIAKPELLPDRGSEPQSSSLSSPIMSSISICSHPPLAVPEPNPRVYCRPKEACLNVTGMPATLARKLSPMHDERARNTSRRRIGMKKSRLRSTQTFILVTWCLSEGRKLDPEFNVIEMSAKINLRSPLAIFKSSQQRQRRRTSHLHPTQPSMMINRMLQAPLGAYLLLSCAYQVSAHGGDHGQQVVVAPDADWPTRHMAGMITYDERLQRDWY